jgi:hypothetical protein
VGLVRVAVGPVGFGEAVSCAPGTFTPPVPVGPVGTAVVGLPPGVPVVRVGLVARVVGLLVGAVGGTTPV